MSTTLPPFKAYLAPLGVFMALMGAGEAVAHLFNGQAWWVFADPRYWIFPLQTAVCGAIVAYFWRCYGWQAPARVGFTIAVATGVFVLWVSPQALLGWPPRLDGFDPGFFAGSGWPYHTNLLLRFVRLVVVVPLVEEIFWRGFLLRYLIDPGPAKAPGFCRASFWRGLRLWELGNEDFTKVPFGTFRWASFCWVSVFFTLVHSGPDRPAALATGALYNLVAIRTRSLSSCVLAHAITNLLLGLYILKTGQWGFW